MLKSKKLTKRMKRAKVEKYSHNYCEEFLLSPTNLVAPYSANKMSFTCSSLYSLGSQTHFYGLSLFSSFGREAKAVTTTWYAFTVTSKRDAQSLDHRFRGVSF